MSNAVIFKTFRTYKHPYVYDRHTDSLLILSEDEYRELLKVEKGELPHEQSPVIKKYQELGILKSNVVEKIEHPGTEIIEHYLKTRMKQLTLQVTQQCNMRCEYCIYSGIYDNNRTHSNHRMSLETAKKAIDFFLERNGELPIVVIGFYGGEPLLEFDLIRQCVEYAKSRVEGKKIRFNMTTNGTLLTDSVVDYMVENDFTLCISLDGSKQEHDVSRKFVNGEGSFDIIIHNIERIQKRHPEYYKEIMILTTINPYMDLGCALEYFSTKEIFSDKQIIFNAMNEINLNRELNYDKNYFKIRNFEHIKMLSSLIGKLDKKYVSPLTISSRSKVERRQKHIHNHSEILPITHHGGPCLAGVQRLFVRVDGTLFPCERVNEMIDNFKIGTLDDGLDVGKIKKLINIGELTDTECKKCWNLRQCSICAREVDFEANLPRESKLRECPKSCSNALFDMYELCALNEFDLDIEETR
ncbi:uncharacterized protein SAMN02745823_01178 [Sporobacter termitidis DSM 10068]|uniref:Radical SAM core domain-containing protein n=1 Tax=Sporobacter termitidis DSM 10068 TaxID=1123282 RepID=A0A1M5WBP3_9FIRM|nr:Cys-rich peptide radical SAM maturase CcpM [Sporobacter termitidis]SHH84912.1 uncharacterized protein SAMN02745823_01178 [Sporobacter termitidis DSM 10068]